MTKVHPVDKETLDKVIKEDTEIDLSDEKEEGPSPWVAKNKFPWWWKITVVVIGPLLLVLRLIFILLSFLISYLISVLSLASCSTNQNTPPSRLQSLARQTIITIFRGLIYTLGVIVRTKGSQATSDEAPILVAAPHSTILDWIVIAVTRSCPVAKHELSTYPVLGTIGEYKHQKLPTILVSLSRQGVEHCLDQERQ